MEDIMEISWDMEFNQLAGHQWEFDRFFGENHGDIMQVNGIGDPAFTMGTFDGIQASNIK